MEWDECLRGKVRKRVPNPEQARALVKMASARFDFIRSGREKGAPSLIAEGYYDVIKDMMTALMASDGYKSYSHECLTAFLSRFYSDIPVHDRELIDQLRMIRNNISYRGLVLENEYLERNEKDILEIIGRLHDILKRRLDET